MLGCLFSFFPHFPHCFLRKDKFGKIRARPKIFHLVVLSSTGLRRKRFQLCMEAARSGSKAEPLQDLQLGNLWTRVNLLQVVSHRTIDLHRSRLRTVAGSVIVRLLISRSSRPDFIADLFPSICIWKIWEGLEKIWEGFVSLPWFVISVLDAIFLKPTAGRVLYIFILYLTPPKSSFRPQNQKTHHQVNQLDDSECWVRLANCPHRSLAAAVVGVSTLEGSLSRFSPSLHCQLHPDKSQNKKRLCKSDRWWQMIIQMIDSDMISSDSGAENDNLTICIYFFNSSVLITRVSHVWKKSVNHCRPGEFAGGGWCPTCKAKVRVKVVTWRAGALRKPSFWQRSTMKTCGKWSTWFGEGRLTMSSSSI